MSRSKMKVVPITLEDKARLFKRIKDKISMLESEAKDLNKELTVAAQMSGGELQAGPFVIKVSDCQRDNFNLKNAVEKLGHQLLKEFITTSEYTQLRVTLTEEE